MDLPDEIAARRAGTGDPAALVGEFRRASVLVPIADDGLMSADLGGIRWIYAFTDEAALRRFTEGLKSRPPATGRLGDAVPAEPREYIPVLGARLLDVVIPAAKSPMGIAVDVGDEDRMMLFPPVAGIVPDEAAVDVEDAESTRTGESAEDRRVVGDRRP